MACPSVLLGLVGAPVPSKSGDTGWWVNKVGGHPDFFAQPPDAELLHCRRCLSELPLIMQLYCPLEGSRYHRLLHLFGCLATTCQGHSESWLVLRSEMLDLSEECTTKVISATDWCESADDWDNELSDMVEVEGSIDDLDLFQTALDSREQQPGGRKSTSSEAVSSHEAIAATATDHRISLPCFYIDAVQESNMSSVKTPTSHELDLMGKYESEHRISLQQMAVEPTTGKDNETYEKAVVAHGDKAFCKFYKRIQCCPQQSLRYERSGVPLVISSQQEQQPPKEIPHCPNCQGARLFEMQLMPALVHILNTSSPIAEHLDFGSVLVYTCSNSCWNLRDTFRVEYAFVQSED